MVRCLWPFARLYDQWVIWRHVLVQTPSILAPSRQMPVGTPNIVLTLKSPHQFPKMSLRGQCQPHWEAEPTLCPLHRPQEFERSCGSCRSVPWYSGVSPPPPGLTLLLSGGGAGRGAGGAGSRRVTEQHERWVCCPWQSEATVVEGIMVTSIKILNVPTCQFSNWTTGNCPRKNCVYSKTLSYYWKILKTV